MPYSTANTTVVLLAAGHGKRMLPLTKTTPKPLLKVGGVSLIEHHLQRLSKLGFVNIVINLAYLGEQIKEELGDGQNYGLSIRYSDESNVGPLETAGGLQHALPLINSNPFIAINADIWTDYPFNDLLSTPLDDKKVSARLIMVSNPLHNLKGDFAINASSSLLELKSSRQLSYTYSGIALYDKSIFTKLKPGVQALAPIFKSLIAQQQVEARIHTGRWLDIGTPERLKELNLHHLNK